MGGTSDQTQRNRGRLADSADLPIGVDHEVPLAYYETYFDCHQLDQVVVGEVISTSNSFKS